MATSQARAWIVWSSFVSLLLLGVIFLTLPSLGFPISYENSLHFIEIIAPAFAGQLSLAMGSLFFTYKKVTFWKELNTMTIKILIISPICIYWTFILSLLFSFYTSNQPGAEIGEGMTLETLARGISIGHALFIACSNSLIYKLFKQENE